MLCFPGSPPLQFCTDSPPVPSSRCWPAPGQQLHPHMAHKLLAAMDHSHQCHNPSKDDVFWTKKNASPRVFHFCRGGVRNLSTHGSNGFWAKAKRFNPGPAHPPTTCAFSSLHSVVACPVEYRPTGCGDEITKQSQIRGRRCHPYVFSLAEQSQTKKLTT